MRSYKFPNMFNSNSSNIWKEEDHLKATKQNAYLVIKTEKKELECDPFFGVSLGHYLFEQNSSVFAEALVDTLYTQLAVFLPQIKIDRKSIIVNKAVEKGKVSITFSGINRQDMELNTFKLVLFENTLR